ncbi:helix-turn-helix domain-containing protein [Pinibacter aurantiacus]|uniref:Helix-turn-helix domain-containing protein n=1 Tax=Pinibacter aurantiacus TaxID=2851599 RepID=A0A9E2SAF0_9BACT|nr:helix-turn-helix transcriptional regulator [Pinibacter aurantiacus]MBV4356840.1 helix-turn-helix domain-containing protein [Pinibacter aurantiacus]
MIYFGKNLRFLREKEGIKQNKMADSAGFNRTTWNGYENDNSYPDFEDLVRISDFFGIPESVLIRTDLSKNGYQVPEKTKDGNLVEDEAEEYSSLKSEIEKLQRTVDQLTEHNLLQSEKIKSLNEENASLNEKLKIQSADQ